MKNVIEKLTFSHRATAATTVAAARGGCGGEQGQIRFFLALCSN